MKTQSVFASIVFLFFTLSAMAQSSAIDRYFEKYKDDDRFSEITVSSKMFNMFANFDMEDPDNQELVEAISKLKGMKLLIGEAVEEAASLQENFISSVDGKMEELMSVREGSTNLKFFVNESNGVISELFMAGREGNELILLSLVGEIDLKQVAKLSKKLNIDGFEHLEEVDE